jgi:hypothetical protein
VKRMINNFMLSERCEILEAARLEWKCRLLI